MRIAELYPLVTPEELAEDDRREEAEMHKRELELQAVPMPICDHDSGSLLTRPSRRTARSKTPLMNPVVRDRLRQESGKIDVTEETRQFDRLDLAEIELDDAEVIDE